MYPTVTAPSAVTAPVWLTLCLTKSRSSTGTCFVLTMSSICRISIDWISTKPSRSSCSQTRCDCSMHGENEQNRPPGVRMRKRARDISVKWVPSQLVRRSARPSHGRMPVDKLLFTWNSRAGCHTIHTATHYSGALLADPARIGNCARARGVLLICLRKRAHTGANAWRHARTNHTRAHTRYAASLWCAPCR